MAKSVRQKLVLFFLAGAVASEEEREAIAEFDGDEYRVMFRNASFVNEGDTIEKFDLVAGAVPDNYARAAEAQGEPAEPINGAEDEAAKAAKAEEARKKAPPAAPAGQGGAWGGGAKPAGWKPNA